MIEATYNTLFGKRVISTIFSTNTVSQAFGTTCTFYHRVKA